ncbi:uncharacterized protein [Diadema setosum]|uniref:uncharacterized protein n=1 Tax=Diadema setosum TaxID=31175 RepID=UPI003B3B7EAF
MEVEPEGNTQPFEPTMPQAELSTTTVAQVLPLGFAEPETADTAELPGVETSSSPSQPECARVVAAPTSPDEAQKIDSDAHKLVKEAEGGKSTPELHNVEPDSKKDNFTGEGPSSTTEPQPDTLTTQHHSLSETGPAGSECDGEKTSEDTAHQEPTKELDGEPLPKKAKVLVDDQEATKVGVKCEE